MAVLAVSYSGPEITGGLNEAPLTVDLVSKSEQNRSRTFRDIEVQRFGFVDRTGCYSVVGSHFGATDELYKAAYTGLSRLVNKQPELKAAPGIRPVIHPLKNF